MILLWDSIIAFIIKILCITKFYASQDVYVLTVQCEYNLIYIYNYLKAILNLQGCKGSTIKHSSKTALSKNQNPHTKKQTTYSRFRTNI